MKIRRLDNDQLKALGNSQRGNKLLMNIPNYDILQNQRYADAFLYTTLDSRFENASSDIVAQILCCGEDKIQKDEEKREDTEENVNFGVFSKI